MRFPYSHRSRSSVLLHPWGYITLLISLTMPLTAAIPENFKTENLVPWCFVPFDAAKRTPVERAAMLQDLGLRRSAYDWRAEHVPEFEAEILAYRKAGIEYVAFWGGHDAAFTLFKQYGLYPQIWKMFRFPEGGIPETQATRIEGAVNSLLPHVEKALAHGCSFGIYNHGDWGGEPVNMVAVVKALRERTGSEAIGIVYNFHHGHEDIADFSGRFALMRPYLLCLNLNGMVDPQDMNGWEKKILPIGSGTREREMIKFVLKSGYVGPIGILDHRSELDARTSLEQNIKGLELMLNELVNE